VEEHSCGDQDLNGATAPEDEKSVTVQWCKNVLYTQKYKIIILWINNYFENFVLGHHLRFPVILDMDTYGNSHHWIVLMKHIWVYCNSNINFYSIPEKCLHAAQYLRIIISEDLQKELSEPLNTFYTFKYQELS